MLLSSQVFEDNNCIGTRGVDGSVSRAAQLRSGARAFWGAGRHPPSFGGNSAHPLRFLPGATLPLRRGKRVPVALDATLSALLSLDRTGGMRRSCVFADVSALALSPLSAKHDNCGMSAWLALVTAVAQVGVANTTVARAV
jgi:hypothetical protein